MYLISQANLQDFLTCSRVSTAEPSKAAVAALTVCEFEAELPAETVKKDVILALAAVGPSMAACLCPSLESEAVSDTVAALVAASLMPGADAGAPSVVAFVSSAALGRLPGLRLKKALRLACFSVFLKGLLS